jgi:hypothetical protein
MSLDLLGIPSWPPHAAGPNQAIKLTAANEESNKVELESRKHFTVAGGSDGAFA